MDNECQHEWLTASEVKHDDGACELYEYCIHCGAYRQLHIEAEATDARRDDAPYTPPLPF